MSKINILCFSIAALFAVSCSTDIDIHGPWEEIHVVYGLIDPNDSVQVIKINKAFQNIGTDYLDIVTNEDSLYHNDSISVTLKEWNNGAVVKDVHLYRIRTENKDSGLFSAPGQYLYRTPSEFIVKPERTYQLDVVNTATGTAATASTPIVQSALMSQPRPGGMINLSDTEDQNRLMWTSGANARFYDLNVIINYMEFREDGSSDTTYKKLVWPVFWGKLTGSTRGREDQFHQLQNKEFYRHIGNSLTPPPHPNIRRKLLYFDFEYSSGAEEIYTYMSVQRPSIGVVQKKSDYTNVQNGYGIFSSRRKDTFRLFPTPATVSTLITHPETGDLRFTR